MKHILLCMTGLFLLSTVIYGNAEVPIKPTVILQPSWTQIFSGETVTVRCEIQGGGGTQWTYEWSPAKLNTPPTSNEYRISRATESDSGGYRCRGRRDYLLTGWSDTITLTVSSGKPRATLTAQSSIIPPGGSVTLSCSVEGSAGWKFDWFRRDSVSSEAQLMRGNEANRDIRVSQGGLYHCRGGRGGPAFFSEDSNEVTVEETLPIKPTVILQPSWTQIFSGETVTVRCEIQGGGGTQWTYEWSPAKLNTPTSNEYRIFRATESDSGGYRCRGRRDYLLTGWSDTITLTVSSLDVKTAALAKSPEEVSGYLGETITLPSGANPSWNLTKIEWSIFAINTWIATYRKGKTNTDRVPQYKGRLSLNTTSGDLTIHNLIADDAREYNVDLLHSEDTANKIILRVKQRLQQPSIQIVTSTSIENGCLMVMHCSSPDNGVTLSWSVEPLGVLTISKRNPSDSSVQLFAFVNTTQNFASFTCNSSRNAESVSSNPVTPKCDGKLCSPV